MGLLAFIAELAKALGWPLAVVIGVLVLRKPLTTLLLALRHVKYGELEADFGEQLEKVAAEARRALPPLAAEPQQVRGLLPELGEDSKLAQLAEISPHAAIVESWADVEEAARAATSARTKSATSMLGSTRRALEQRGADAETLSLYDNLRSLRNQAAHNRRLQITTGEAVEFGMLARRLATKLRALSEAPNS
jgi:hypothetical protein